jgi:hypothetical protein
MTSVPWDKRCATRSIAAEGGVVQLPNLFQTSGRHLAANKRPSRRPVGGLHLRLGLAEQRWSQTVRVRVPFSSLRLRKIQQVSRDGPNPGPKPRLQAEACPTKRLQGSGPRHGLSTGHPYGQRQRQSACRFAHAKKPKADHTEWWQSVHELAEALRAPLRCLSSMIPVGPLES